LYTFLRLDARDATSFQIRKLALGFSGFIFRRISD
jgi:hypothetical protein